MMTTIDGDHRRVDELEGLRGIAALLVVLYHMPPWNPALSRLGLIRNGYLMVDLFFVLSGFVIFNAYADRIRSPRDLARFQFLRFGRLYPVHLVMLLAFAAIEVGKFVVETSGTLIPNGKAFSVNGGRALIEQILLVQAIGPTGNALSFNAPAWSISVEFYTYLLFGLVVVAARRSASWIFPLVGALSLLLLVTGRASGFELFVECSAGFFVGCVAAQACRHASSRVGRHRVERHLSAAALLCFVAFVDFRPDPRADWAITLLSFVLIVALVRGDDGPARRLLRSPALVWLGGLSYTIYMVHSLVIFAARQVLRRTTHQLEVMIDGTPVTMLSFVEALVLNASVVAVVVALSVLLHRGLEQPWRERSRRAVERWSRRRRSA